MKGLAASAITQNMYTLCASHIVSFYLKKMERTKRLTSKIITGESSYVPSYNGIVIKLGVLTQSAGWTG